MYTVVQNEKPVAVRSWNSTLDHRLGLYESSDGFCIRMYVPVYPRIVYVDEPHDADWCHTSSEIVKTVP